MKPREELELEENRDDERLGESSKPNMGFESDDADAQSSQHKDVFGSAPSATPQQSVHEDKSEAEAEPADNNQKGSAAQSEEEDDDCSDIF